MVNFNPFGPEIKALKTTIKYINWGFYKIDYETKGLRVINRVDPFKWLLKNKKGDIIGKVKVDVTPKGDWLWTVYGTKGFDVQPEVFQTAKGAFGALIRAHRKYLGKE